MDENPIKRATMTSPAIVEPNEPRVLDTGTGGGEPAPAARNGAALNGSAAKPRQTSTLTKAELAEMLFNEVGLNKREAKDMVETFFDEISAALVRGESVKLSGFGNFLLRDKPQRPGRNPKTGEEIPISARRVVTFHASQKLKAQIDAPRRAAREEPSAQRATLQPDESRG
jgi:integration host factor subunit alpha